MTGEVSGMGFMGFYGMTRQPFAKDIPTDRLCMGAGFRDAVERLEYGVRCKRFTVLTGPCGCGKSTALRALHDRLPSEKYRCIYISESNLTPRWLYAVALRKLGIEPRYYLNDAKRQFQDELLSLRQARGLEAVMIIDEAHLIGGWHRRETLEEIRFLLNGGYDSGNTLALILCGQDELWGLLESAGSKAVSQRIELVARLRPLPGPAETAEYIRAHLDASGCAEDLFSSDAVARIHAASGGEPRRINWICSCCLLYSAARSERMVQERTVSEVVENEMPGMPAGAGREARK
ncbi:MAG: ExeA family protein [Succinivibrio sp.]